MTKLTNRLRKAIIDTLVEGACYREQLDMSRFLRAGVTEYEIGLLDYACNLLKCAPYLDNEDFLSKQLSQYQIDNVLGGIGNLKAILGFKDYCFLDWLHDENYLDREGICLPYWLYLKFADEIRAEHTEGVSLAPYLSVQLNDNLQVQSIPTHDDLHTKIPMSDAEAAFITAFWFVGRHRCISYAPTTSIMTFRSGKSSKLWQCEIRCLSSRFQQDTPYGICVLDDDGKPAKSKGKKRIGTYAQLLTEVTVH